MQIHHARQSGGESKSVLDAAVSVQPHQSVPLRDIMQKTDFQKANHQESVERVALLCAVNLNGSRRKRSVTCFCRWRKKYPAWVAKRKKEMRDYLRHKSGT